MKRNLSEAPTSVNKSLYTNTDFKDKIVGSSTPSKDKINPSLLADVDKAAKAANVKVSITTAVTGHRNSGRHPKGNAVDIAMVNGKGFGSMSAAKSNGIYDDINRFVDELVKMGYKKNSESGNDKAVLTFGFPAHDNHIHVSRNSDDGTSPSKETNIDFNDTDDDKTDDVKIDSDKTVSNDDSSKTEDPEKPEDYGMMGQFLKMVGFKENYSNVNGDILFEEIKRIKQLL